MSFRRRMKSYRKRAECGISTSPCTIRRASLRNVLRSKSTPARDREGKACFRKLASAMKRKIVAFAMLPYAAFAAATVHFDAGEAAYADGEAGGIALSGMGKEQQI